MTPFACAELTRDRLKLWQRDNARHALAVTPVVLINIGHGEISGQIHINTLEDLKPEQLLGFLKGAAAEIERQINERKPHEN